MGFFIVVPSFLIPAWIEYRIGLGETPGIVWQLLAYLLLTLAEVMISVTCLEFSYTQAPRTMKSLVFGLFMASIALGNLFTSLVNVFILNEDGSSKLDGPDYYLFFAGAMFVTALIFVPVSMAYREKTYLHE
jgi:POT family proton-dependent oligopeptide transporter